MKIITTLLILLLILLQYHLWFGAGSKREVQRLRQQISQIQEKNQQLKERNLALTAEVFDLKKGQEAIEELARTEMGMIKHDETFYQVIEYANSEVQSN